MPRFVIASENTEIRSRVLFDTSDPGDDRLERLSGFVEVVGAPRLSTTHQCMLAAGPETSGFAGALAAYGFTYYQPLRQQVIDAAMRHLREGTGLPEEMVSDNCLPDYMASSFVIDLDWEHTHETCTMLAHAYLGAHFDGYDVPLGRLGREELINTALLTGALSVALAKARADWEV